MWQVKGGGGRVGLSMSCSGIDEFTLPDGSVAKVVALALHYKRSRFYSLLLFLFFTTSHLKDIYFTSVSLEIAAAFKIHPGPSARPTAEETCCKKPNTAHSHTVQVSPKTHLHLIAETLLRPWPAEVASCSDALIWPLPVLLQTNQDKSFIPNRHSLKKKISSKFWPLKLASLAQNADFPWTFATKLDSERSSFALSVFCWFLFVLWTPLEKPGCADERRVCGFGASLWIWTDLFWGVDGNQNWLESSNGMAFLTDQYCNIKALASVHIEVPFTGWDCNWCHLGRVSLNMTQQIAAVWDWHLCQKKNWKSTNNTKTKEKK